jgi:hypothetical protein
MSTGRGGLGRADVVSEPTPDEVAQTRLKIAELEFRAKSDQMFLRELRADPVRVLQAQGFEDPMANEVARQLSGDSAAAKSDDSGCPVCDLWTCIATGCCWFTSGHPPPHDEVVE